MLSYQHVCSSPLIEYNIICIWPTKTHSKRANLRFHFLHYYTLYWLFDYNEQWQAMWEDVHGAAHRPWSIKNLYFVFGIKLIAHCEVKVKSLDILMLLMRKDFHGIFILSVAREFSNKSLINLQNKICINISPQRPEARCKNTSAVLYWHSARWCVSIGFLWEFLIFIAIRSPKHEAHLSYL